VVDAAPRGSVVELAPGRYDGPIVLRRPLTLKGAGELTRLIGGREAPVIDIASDEPGLIFVESVAIEEGAAASGAGVRLRRGRVRMYNVHAARCQAEKAGGFLSVMGGELEASLLRVSSCAADRGGALHVEGAAQVSLRDSEIRNCQAELGGGISVRGHARLRMISVALGGTHARRPSGGQVIWAEGGRLDLDRVRFEDVPIGLPLKVEASARVELRDCDLPSDVLRNPGIVDAGGNRWR
jgi:hypothetical protein